MYGKHLEIKSEINGRQAGRRVPKRVTLQENQSVDTLLGLKLHLSVLYQGFSRGYDFWQCYKVSSTWNGSQRIDFHLFRMRLSVGLPSPYEPGLRFQPYKEARVTATSEENAYGQT